MIVDDVEGFLKFLDNASYQLACLLDIDGQRKGNLASKAGTNCVRRRASLTSSTAATNKPRATRSRAIKYSTNVEGNKRQQIKHLTQPIRVRGRGRRSKLEDLLETTNHQNDPQQQQQQQHQQQQQQLVRNTTNLDQSLHSHHHNHQQQQNSQQQLPLQELQGQHQIGLDLEAHQHQQQTSTKIHLNHQLHNQQNSTPTETHTLDGQLTLSSLTDDLPSLDHVPSISPATHGLSPLDPSIQFSTMHPQHYYTTEGQRAGHTLDSYQLHDEFATTHDQIPISNTSPRLSSSQDHHQHHLQHHHHQQQHQQQRNTINHHPDHHITTNTSHQHESQTITSDDVPPLIVPADCYQNHQLHHHQHQQQQQQHQQQHHQTLQYHSPLEQQWLSSSVQNSDGSLHLGVTDSVALEHVVPMSPSTQQSLEQVQFSSPLYPHSYYNHQAEQLDTFQHINDDYQSGPTITLTSSSSSPMGANIHRVQQDQQQQQTQHHQPQTITITNLDMNNGHVNGGSYDQQQGLHHHHQQQQQHHHQLPHQQHQLQQQHNQHVNAQSEHHQLHSPYCHHQHHQHHQQGQHHHSQHGQMMPGLMNGLEPSGVIIQDINLASATWSSPEDLYGI